MSEVTLSEICELIVDCPHSTAIDEGKGYPLVRTPNIGKGRLIYSGMHRDLKMSIIRGTNALFPKRMI